jgi:hypothetical protein
VFQIAAKMVAKRPLIYILCITNKSSKMFSICETKTIVGCSVVEIFRSDRDRCMDEILQNFVGNMMLLISVSLVWMTVRDQAKSRDGILGLRVRTRR